MDATPASPPRTTAGGDTDYADIRARLLFALALTLPVVAVASLGETHITDSTIAPLSRRWIEFVLSAPVVVWAAAPIFRRGIAGLFSGHAGRFMPLSLGIGILFLFSTVSLIYPSAIPVELHRLDGQTPQFFDTAAIVVVLTLASLLCERWLRARLASANRAIETLHAPSAPEAFAQYAISWLAPAVVVAGLAAYLYWAEYAPAPSMWRGFFSTVTVLIVAGLGTFALAAPFAELAAAIRGAKNGIAVHDPRALEIFARADVLLLDDALAVANFANGKATLLPDARENLSRLRENGLTVTLVSARDEAHAKEIGTELGLQKPAVTPDGKADLVRTLQAKGRIVAVAGTAVSFADVSISPNGDAAGLALSSGDLASLVRARRLARATMRNMTQSLVFAVLYNAIAIAAAGGAFYFYAKWTPSPVLGALAMSLSSLVVIANALRLRNVKL